MAVTFQPPLMKTQLQLMGRSDLDICSTAQWLSFYQDDAEKIAAVWGDQFAEASTAACEVADVQAGDRDSPSPSPGEHRTTPTENRCLALLHLVNELLALTQWAKVGAKKKTFAQAFSAVLPPTLLRIPRNDTVYFEVQRLSHTWSEKQLLPESVLQDLRAQCRVPPFGQKLNYTSSREQLVAISKSISEVTAARQGLRVFGQKRKAEEETGSVLAERIERIEESLAAHRKVRATVQEVRDFLEANPLSEGQKQVAQLRLRLRALQKEQEAKARAAEEIAKREFEEAAAAAAAAAAALQEETPAPSVSPAPMRPGDSLLPQTSTQEDKLEAGVSRSPSRKMSPAPEPQLVQFTVGQTVVCF